MVSHKIRRKKKHSRRTHKERNNNTKKKHRRKNRTRKNRSKLKMKGGGILRWNLDRNNNPTQFRYEYEDGRPTFYLTNPSIGPRILSRFNIDTQNSSAAKSFSLDDVQFDRVYTELISGAEPVTTPTNSDPDDVRMSDGDEAPSSPLSPSSPSRQFTTEEEFSHDEKVKAILNYNDPNFTVDIKKQQHNDKKTMIITDKHRIWNAEGANDDDRNLHRNLMVMLNLVDIIHDVIASGDLSYYQETSFRNLITGYSILYNFDENKAKQIICQALYFNEDIDFLEILKNVMRRQDLKGGEFKKAEGLALFGRPMGLDNPGMGMKKGIDAWNLYLENEINNKANSCRTTGHKIEEYFKTYFVHCIPNKFLLNPREANGIINAELLTEWENLKTEGQVLSYGGGSVKGYEFWRYIIGRGNSILNKTHGLYDGETVNVPSDDNDLLKLGLLKFINYEKTKMFLDPQGSINEDKFRFDLNRAIEQDQEETNLEKVNFLIKIITDLSSYGTMNTIMAGITSEAGNKLSIIFTNDIMQNVEFYRLYYFYKTWTSKYSTESQKQLIINKYESQYINRYDKQEGIIKKGTQFTKLLNHPIQCNFTDAVGKAASALHLAWEKIQNASDNYSLSSGAIIEQVNIASLIDEASTRLGKKGTISQFEDNRQPIRKKVEKQLGFYGPDDIIKDYEKALLYPVRLTQPLGEGDGANELEVYQEPALPSNYAKTLNFFNLYDTLYTQLLNDVRIMFKTYIETQYKKGPERCTPKDLINLKIRYLFLFMVFVMKEREKPPRDGRAVRQDFDRLRLERVQNLKRLKSDNLSEEDKTALQIDNDNKLCILHDLRNYLATHKYIKKIDEIENTIGNSSDDFMNSKIGEYFKEGMNDGYLNNFFGADKQKTVDIKQWRDQQIFPQNLTYPNPNDSTLPKTRKLLYNQYIRARNEGRDVSGQWIENQSNLNKLSCSPFYYSNNNSGNPGFDLPDLLHKTKDGKHISPIIGKSSKNINQKLNGKTIRLQKRSLAGGPAKKMVHTEYLSTDLSFNDASLDLEINKFEGWMRENFTGCNCAVNTKPLSELRLINHLGEEVTLKQLTVNDYEILLSLKGLCVKVKSSGKFGKLAILPVEDNRSAAKKTYRKKKFTMRIFVNERNDDDNRRIKVPIFSKTMGLKNQAEKDLFIQYLDNHEYCDSTKGIELVGAGVDDPNDNAANVPLEFFSIFQNQYTKLEKTDDQGRKIPCILINSHFEKINKTKEIDFSHMATYCGMDLFNILTERNDNERYIKSFIKEYPYLSKLLYNSFLFDFEPAEALDSTVFYGSRTTGRINWGAHNEYVIMKNKTFIQKSLDTAKHILEKLKSEVKTGKMTITYRNKAGGNELEIRATSEAPSVSNVLEQYRQTLVLFLLHTKKLSQDLYNAIIADKGEIFKLDNRGTKEKDTSRDLVKKIIDAFNDYKPPNQSVNISQAEKALLKIMKSRNSIIEFYEQFKNKTITWEKKNKITIKPLSNDDNRAKTRLDWLKSGLNRFILSSTILSLKTQSDGMQLIVGKALKLVYPIDDKGLETIFHVLTYDHMCAIKGLEKGTPLLLQTERSVIMGFFGKTGYRSYNELLVPDSNASGEDFESNMMVQIKDMNYQKNSSNLNNVIKLWYDSKLRPYHYDFGVDKSYIAGKYTQKMISEIKLLTQNYKRTLECIDVLYSKLENNGVFGGYNSKELGYTMEYNLFGLGGSQMLPSGTNLNMSPEFKQLYDRSIIFANLQLESLHQYIDNIVSNDGFRDYEAISQYVNVYLYPKFEAILVMLNAISESSDFSEFNFQLDDEEAHFEFGGGNTDLTIKLNSPEDERNRVLATKQFISSTFKNDDGEPINIEPIVKDEMIGVLNNLMERYVFNEDEEYSVDILKDKYLPNLKLFLNFFMTDYKSVLMGDRAEVESDEKRRYKIINLQVFLYANIINKIIEKIFELNNDNKEKIIKYYKIIKILLRQSHILVTKTTPERDEVPAERKSGEPRRMRLPSSPGGVYFSDQEDEISEANIIPAHKNIEDRGLGFSKSFYKYVIYRLKRHHNKSEFLINNVTVLDKLISSFHEIVYLKSLVFVDDKDLTNELIEFFKSKKSKASNKLIKIVEKANSRIKKLYNSKNFQMLVSMGVERLSNERATAFKGADAVGPSDQSRSDAGKRRRKETGERDTTGDIMTQLNQARAELAAVQARCSGMSTAESLHKAEIKTKNIKIEELENQIQTERREIQARTIDFSHQQQQYETQIAQMRAQIQAQQEEINRLTPDDDVDMNDAS